MEAAPASIEGPARGHPRRTSVPARRGGRRVGRRCSVIGVRWSGSSGAETGERAPPLTGGRSATVIAAPAEAAAAGGSALLLLFVASLFVPGRFPLGPVWLSCSSLFLLLAILPFALHWVRGKAGPIVAADILVLLFCLWQALSVVAIHGVGRVFYVGSVFVETAGAYLVGRMLVRSAADYRASSVLFRLPRGAAALRPGRARAREAAAAGRAGGTCSRSSDVKRERRLGLVRVALSFPHPILLRLRLLARRGQRLLPLSRGLAEADAGHRLRALHGVRLRCRRGRCSRRSCSSS